MQIWKNSIPYSRLPHATMKLALKTWSKLFYSYVNFIVRGYDWSASLSTSIADTTEVIPRADSQNERLYSVNVGGGYLSLLTVNESSTMVF